jgi:hypothetical protein
VKHVLVPVAGGERVLEVTNKKHAYLQRYRHIYVHRAQRICTAECKVRPHVMLLVWRNVLL